MEVYRGVTIYNNREGINFGRSLPKQEKQKFTKYERRGWPSNMDSMKHIKKLGSRKGINPNWSITSEKKLLEYQQTGETVMVGGEYNGKRRPISAKIETINKMKKDYRQKTNTMNLTLDQLKGLLNNKKAEFQKLTKAVQNQFNFTFSTSYDPDIVQTQVQSTKSASMIKKDVERTPSKDRLFRGQKNVMTCWNHIKSSSESAFVNRRKTEQQSKADAQ